MTTLQSHDQIKQQINDRLKQLYDKQCRQARKIDDSYAELIGNMGEFIARGGKRTRPYLTYLSYAGFGGTDTGAILDVATGQEVLHNFLLIHDDIIDRDNKRYNGPNITGLYKRLNKDKVKPSQLNHHAVSTALLAGDINHVLAYKTITNSRFDNDLKVEAMEWVAQTTLAVIGGELLDVNYSHHSRQDYDRSQLLKVARYKTASYSFEGPLILGALLARGKLSARRPVSDFATAAGIAYQLQDDILGVFGNDETGKSKHSDLKEGKQTLLIHYGFKFADSKQRVKLKNCLGNSLADDAELEQAKQILIDTGARDKVAELAQRLLVEAETLLPLIEEQGLDQAAAARLHDLILSTRNRNS